jgi:hypothetical protein
MGRLPFVILRLLASILFPIYSQRQLPAVQHAQAWSCFALPGKSDLRLPAALSFVMLWFRLIRGLPLLDEARYAVRSSDTHPEPGSRRADHMGLKSFLQVRCFMIDSFSGPGRYHRTLPYGFLSEDVIPLDLNPNIR